MRFVAVTDTSGNLPTKKIREADLKIIAFPYFIDGEEFTCLDTASFDGDAFLHSQMKETSGFINAFSKAKSPRGLTTEETALLSASSGSVIF